MAITRRDEIHPQKWATSKMPPGLRTAQTYPISSAHLHRETLTPATGHVNADYDFL